MCGEPSDRADELARKVIGAAIEVHRYLGPGFLESIYEEALAVELALRGLAFVQQSPMAVQYKTRKVGAGRLDFFVEDELVVEIKAVDRITPLHTAQVMSYLKAVDRSLGLLLNFKVAVLKQGIQRVVLSNRHTRTLGVLGVLAVDNN